MKRRGKFPIRTAVFELGGEPEFVTAEPGVKTLGQWMASWVDRGPGQLHQVVRRRAVASGRVVEEVDCVVPADGCEILEIGASVSGRWLVTQRCSGQGEWGYDVFRTKPLARVGGILSASGYVLDLPAFSEDETRVVGGFGERWLDGWWSEEGEAEHPARGGRVVVGTIFEHSLESGTIEHHDLVMDLPAGWIPEDPEAETWYGPRGIAPLGRGIRMVLPGGVPWETSKPLERVVALPTPHPRGGGLLG